MTNLPPFYIGQKVVCVKECFSIHSPIKDKRYKITSIFTCGCGVHLVSWGNNSATGNLNCHKCFCSLSPSVNEYYLCSTYFRAIEEKPQYMTFEKIHELEKEEVLINN